MTNEQKLREIAEKWGWFVKATSIDMTQFELNKDTEQCLSDLTALISEGYYPKEFLFWLLNGYTFLKSDQSFVVNYPYMTEHNDYRHFTSDELYQYWEENVK